MGLEEFWVESKKKVGGVRRVVGRVREIVVGLKEKVGG